MKSNEDFRKLLQAPSSSSQQQHRHQNYRQTQHRHQIRSHAPVAPPMIPPPPHPAMPLPTQWIQHHVQGEDNGKQIIYFDPLRKWFTRRSPAAPPVAMVTQGGALKVVEKRLLKLVRERDTYSNDDDIDDNEGKEGMFVTLSNGVRFFHDKTAMESHWTVPAGWRLASEAKQMEREEEEAKVENGEEEDVEFEVIEEDDQQIEEHGDGDGGDDDDDLEFEVIDDETGEGIDLEEIHRVVMEEKNMQEQLRTSESSDSDTAPRTVPLVEEVIVEEKVEELPEDNVVSEEEPSSKRMRLESPVQSSEDLAPASEDKKKNEVETEEQNTMFLSLLNDLDIGPFSKWDKYVGVMQADARFLECTLPIVERKDIFANYVKEREIEEEEREKREKESTVEQYQQLLEESAPVVEAEGLTFRKFASRFGNDPRYRNFNVMQRKEILFRKRFRSTRKKK